MKKYERVIDILILYLNIVPAMEFICQQWNSYAVWYSTY